MTASIVLSHIVRSAADGSPLLSDLSLTLGPEKTGLVGRNGSGKSTLLHVISGDTLPESGQVAVRGTLGVLRQNVAPVPGQTLADLFGVVDALAVLDRAEAGLATAADLDGADWTLPARISAALARVGLDLPPDALLERLSGGQSTRLALAALLFKAPDFLLLDEPTNNLDREGRALLCEVLRGWGGGALVVSHDRELLEEMEAILDLSTLGLRRYGGPYSQYRARRDAELEGAERALVLAERQHQETAARAQEAAERKARRDGAGARRRSGGGQAKIMLDFAKGRAEASGGANARLREVRQAEADTRLAEARERVEVLQPLRMDLPPSGLAAGRLVVRLDRVSGGHDPARPAIRDLSISMTGPERIAVTGPNGSGKTTLLSMIAGRLEPCAGRIERPLALAFLDQSISLLDANDSLVGNYRRLNPDETIEAGRAALARFRFRADDALQRTGDLSGGQRLRAALACTLGRSQPPQLLILDEPTNHLDLDSILALQSALLGYDGALLVVSHDAGFLDQIDLSGRLDLAGLAAA